MTNLLNITPDYKVTTTANGVWRRYHDGKNTAFSEFTSRHMLAGRPLLQIATGRSPETGKMAVARGFIAVGQKARGVVAVGQFATGIVAIGQFAVGVVAIGQFAAGAITLGQFAAGLVAVGQTAIGLVAGMGQTATGYFVFAQWGVGVVGKVRDGWGAASLHIARHLLR